MSSFRVCSAVCGLLGLVCAAVAIWGTIRTPGVGESPPADATPRLEIENPVIELGELKSHETVTFDVRITNRSALPGRVLNVSRSCDLGGCFDSTIDGPVEVAPGGSVTYPVRFAPSGSGPFEAQVRMFLDDGGMRQVKVTVRGVAREPEKGDDPIKAP
jgi:hypothetical protein